MKSESSFGEKLITYEPAKLGSQISNFLINAAMAVLYGNNVEKQIASLFDIFTDVLKCGVVPGEEFIKSSVCAGI